MTVTRVTGFLSPAPGSISSGPGPASRGMRRSEGAVKCRAELAICETGFRSCHAAELSRAPMQSPKTRLPRFEKAASPRLQFRNPVPRSRFYFDPIAAAATDPPSTLAADVSVCGAASAASRFLPEGDPSPVQASQPGPAG